MNHDTFDAKKHVRTYILVFTALAFLTVVTVTISKLDLTTAGSIAVALVIAGIKGSLVAAYFMHLISEKKLIFLVLLLAALFFLFLMFGPLATDTEMIRQNHVP